MRASFPATTPGKTDCHSNSDFHLSPSSTGSPGHDVSSESAGSPCFQPTADVDTDQIHPTCRVKTAILLSIFWFLCHGSSPPVAGSRRFCFFSLFFHGLVYRPSLPALGGVITTWKDYVLLDLRESFGLGWVYGDWAVVGPRSPEQGRGTHTVVEGREHVLVRGDGARLRCSTGLIM